MKKIFIALFLAASAMLFAEDLLKQIWLPKGATLLNDNGTTILHIEIPGPKFGNLQCHLPIDLNKYRGKQIEFSAMYRIKNVRKDLPAYFGPKFMLPYAIGGTYNYPEAVPVHSGTCDWTPVRVSMNVTADVTKAELCMGLQNACGIVEYKDLTVRDMSSFTIKLPAGFRCEYTPRVQKLPIFRGVMTPLTSAMTAKDIQDLAKWNANIVRWQFNTGSSKDYDARVKADLAKLDSLLPEFKKAGIYVIWDMHSVPGGRYGQNLILGTAGSLAKNPAGAESFRMYYEQPYVDHFIRTWQMVAEHYKNEPMVIGYDLMNEPTTPGKIPKYDYLELQYMAAKAIRNIDPEKIIIVTSVNWGAPAAFPQLTPFPMKNIWYTTHMYHPGSYTHQGVGAASWKNVLAGKLTTYPNETLTIADLKKTLQPVRDFQLKYGAKILVGEFSAIRWAPGAEVYLKDCISIFEEYQWNWTYHAYREWQGWSVEHGEDPRNNKPVPNTKRKAVLLEGLSNNKK